MKRFLPRCSARRFLRSERTRCGSGSGEPGTTIGTILLVAGAAHMARVSFCSLPVTHSIWKPISEDVAGGVQLNRRVRLLQNRGCVLGTWGIFRPAVLIPHDAETWTAERIRIVLTHEFAHIKRLDRPVRY
jgi:hypothetical protein